MAEAPRYALGAQFDTRLNEIRYRDIERILTEAHHRWLQPAEICEILHNYTRFQIASEPANRPPNGSLFLFDRKVLRFFRKDGHNWRKNKDGKTAKEAHERLKDGSIDVLHCYYAHGEDNENFQRRCYSLLEDCRELSNIVLVHYRDVKGNRTNTNRVREATPNFLEGEQNISTCEVNTSVSSKFQTYNHPVASQTTENSTHALEYEDAESDIERILSEAQQRWLRPAEICGILHNYTKLQIDSEPGNRPPNGSLFLFDRKVLRHFRKDGHNWKKIKNGKMAKEAHERLKDGSVDVLHCYYAHGEDNENFQRRCYSLVKGELSNIVLVHYRDVKGNRTSTSCVNEAAPNSLVSEEKIFTSEVESSQWKENLQPDAGYNNLRTRPHEDVTVEEILDWFETTDTNDQLKPIVHESSEFRLADEKGGNPNLEGYSILIVDKKSSSLKPPTLEELAKEGQKKLDSFDWWTSKDLGDVKESQTQSTSSTYLGAFESENGVDDSIVCPQMHLDSYVLGPSLSHDQLFSIIDFFPTYAYAGSKIKVFITGRFLRSQQELQHCEWACMFGELEVPAMVVADGVLCCHTPDHKPGRVDFYVTCSNRLACSEVREFEFQTNENSNNQGIDGESSSEMLLRIRFAKLLSLESQNPLSSVNDSEMMRQLSSLIQEDNSEWDQMLEFTTSEEEFSSEKARNQVFEKLLKNKLPEWLAQKVAEGGKGASVLDEGGQGVLHFAGALGYEWAIPPTVEAGVSINFRDVNGWTSLHWAAFCGRERTVAFLISQGAAAGALTDPSPRYPSGRTPADLASSNGDEGIAGYCAEAALSTHLQLLKLKDTTGGGKEDSDASASKAVQTVTERTPTPVIYGEGLSLKDSLAAVCNATQAAARIHQVFRVQSFQKKQLKEHGGSELGLSDERALSLLALKTPRTGHHDEPVNAAAVRIQNKFRSWKGRKDFLIMRQRIVKIQAHVRGHLVRKNYKKIVWPVGILDKVILRCRRKGSGLRGFNPEATAESAKEAKPSKEEDDDFFKEGRKQTEQRLQKALARVKSMVQYPEARDQYRRFLNVVNDMQESKWRCYYPLAGNQGRSVAPLSSRCLYFLVEAVLESLEEATNMDEDLFDLDALLA
ncbi:hypothetical protein QVD17_19047 [Tagetes erecta]|uniref:CG-1 domain-containing protein n=1 Tax=Tagetes erecta TaxID=13708 RepID=A0AAD8NWY5_TARER|nr:hypothetical protein QVD17_19047 [Tagetes erecta]